MDGLSTAHASTLDIIDTRRTQHNPRWPLESRSVRLSWLVYLRPWRPSQRVRKKNTRVLAAWSPSMKVAALWRIPLWEHTTTSSHLNFIRNIKTWLIVVTADRCREYYDVGNITSGLGYSLWLCNEFETSILLIHAVVMLRHINGTAHFCRSMTTAVNGTAHFCRSMTTAVYYGTAATYSHDLCDTPLKHSMFERISVSNVAGQE